MPNTIKIKNSGVASNVPAALEFGELAINYADGKLFYKNSSNSVSFITPKVTVSDTPPSGGSVGDVWFESDTGRFFTYYDSFWVEIGTSAGPQGPVGATGATGAAGATGATGATGAAGLIQDFGYDTGDYYGPTVTSTTNLTVTQSRTYYIPIYITGTRAFDRIAIRTNSTFSGTGTIRLGVYNSSAGKPTTVAFDAGTVSATAASTTYTITINQTLNSGWYWLAFNSQTNATTSNFISSTTITYPTMMKYASDGNFAFTQVGWYEAGVTGAFATAGTLVETNNMPIVTLRAA